MAVAPGRKAQQRQGAEKRTELVDRATFQKHQGSGRRAQRLGSGGHRISSPGGASSGRLIDQFKTGESRMLLPQRSNLLIQL
jgi:hypothetical protein